MPSEKASEDIIELFFFLLVSDLSCVLTLLTFTLHDLSNVFTFVAVVVVVVAAGNVAVVLFTALVYCCMPVEIKDMFCVVNGAPAHEYDGYDDDDNDDDDDGM